MKSFRLLTRIIVIINIAILTSFAPAEGLNRIHSFTAASVVQAKSTEDTKESNNKDEIKWPKGPKIAASSAIVMEASTGLILYEKKSNAQHYPASITKIMTTLLAIENCSLNETVKFSKNAVFSIERNSSHIGITTGEELSLEDCLYGIMLESANEVSNAVAEHIAGTTQAFAEMMNERAAELGCKNTHFVNAHGLFVEDHYTSAYDMALISKAALANSTFRKVTGTKSTQIPPTNLQSETRYLNNHQQMLTGAKYPKFKYDGVIGGKTGYTQKARYTLATFAERDGMELIVIIMRDNAFEDQYKDTIKLLNFGFDNYAIYNIADQESESSIDDSLFFTRYSTIANGADSPLQMGGSGNIVLPKTANYKDAKRVVTFLPSSEAQDDKKVIARVSYTYGDKVVGSADILYSEPVAPKLARVNMDQIVAVNEAAVEQNRDLKPIITAIIIIALLLIYAAYYFLVERPKSKRRKAVYDKHRKTSLSFDNDLMKLK